MHWRRKWQPLQCSCLENPRVRGAWWAAVSGVAQSRTRLKRLSSSSSSKQACKQPCPGSCVVGHVPYDRELMAFPSLRRSCPGFHVTQDLLPWFVPSLTSSLRRCRLLICFYSFSLKTFYCFLDFLDHILLNSLTFYLSEKVFIFSSRLEVKFVDYRILDCWLFLF